MKKFNTRKKIILTFLMIFSLILLSGCGGSGSSNNEVDKVQNEQLGYIDGYVFETAEGYTLEEDKGVRGAEGVSVEIDGVIYNTNNEGYFKSNGLISGYQYSVNIVIDKDKNNEPDFVWSENIIVQTNSTININKQEIEKEWNIIMFMSDKSSSLDEAVSYFLETVNYKNNINHLNFFIIHGKYKDGVESHKAYYLTGDGKVEIKDYGIINFSDPSFYRTEIKKIHDKFPAKRTMVTIQSHGNGWAFTGNPGTSQNWLAADTAYADKLEAEGSINVDFTLDSFDIYDIFYNIGFNIEIFNMSACHMGQIEVISDFPDNIDYVLASPSFGYTTDMYVHKDVMRDISSGIFDPKTISKKYVDHYVESLDNNSYGSYPSVKAVYDIKEVNYFVDIFSGISNELNTLFLANSSIRTEFQNYVLKSHENIQSYFDSSLDFEQIQGKDLMGILRYLRDNPSLYGSIIADKASEAYGVLNNIVVYQNYSKGFENLYYDGVNPNQDKFTYKNNNGIAINVKDYYDYQDTWFNQKTNWYKVLEQVSVNYQVNID
jgi:hypothetical protein